MAEATASATGEDLRVASDGPVTTITLDRPDALNALTVPLREALLRAIRRADRDPAIRAIVLTGAGRAFCAGQDLKERLGPEAAALETELRDRYNPLVLAMRESDTPIVGAINGVAAGAGTSLALACDVRVIAEDASIRLAFGRIALVPDSGATWLLPRLVGPSRAAAIALLDEPITASQAVDLGLAVKSVPAADVLAEAQALAARLAGFAPRALALTKRALRHAQETTFSETLEYEAIVQGIAGRTHDHQEGIAAFLEKRPPAFTGD
jgi:2-(1,2-epoxy-1,2-dihydrophenyl)acetyl-CoA isomerase